MKKNILSLFAFAMLAAACGSNESTEQTTADTTTTTSVATPAAPAAPPASNLSEAGTAALVELRDAYLKLKDAFVATDASAADAAAQNLVTATEKLKTQLANENKPELNAQIDSILNGAKEIVAATDDNPILGRKRASFEHISDASYHLFQNAGLTHSGLYVQHCPMAFKNKGASWLAAETDIRNPYYGDKMLECGEVTDTLK